VGNRKCHKKWEVTMNRGHAKRRWWVFQKECDEWGGDCDVLAFIDWLYANGYEIITPKKIKEINSAIRSLTYY